MNALGPVLVHYMGKMAAILNRA
ncbi:hypothetical protein RB2654_19278 [Maritimibacter alkaliphilus HTCC2654]|uniref:Uncharacterized protein n=1 Tax=Maritimibacter alkaliphilus HTCC2654 TaxID=314271 RepID=A3VA16_9RHOB|nr:hypothetical protein RB2654_19278 [Maritimibacter alkaliphilus HTCC2654]